MFQKLLDTTSRLLAVNPLAGKEAELAQLNPQKIYVENLRSLMDVPKKAAEALCEAAVRQGFFSRKVEVMCPDGSVAATADKEEDLPAIVSCWVNEDGQVDQVDTPTASLKRTIFYQLNEQRSSSTPYTRTARNV